MRIFAGEWVAGVLDPAGHGGGPGHREPDGVAAHRGGPEEGRGTPLRQPQEPARIRRGDGPPAQGGLRLPPGDPRRRQLQDPASWTCSTSRSTWPSSASWTATTARPASPSSRANRLGVEFDAADFSRSDFDRGRARPPTTRPCAHVETQVQEMLEENLGAEDAKEWNWQALADQVNTLLGPEDDRPPAQADRQGQPGRVPDRARPRRRSTRSTCPKASRSWSPTGACSRCATGRGSSSRSSSTPDELAGQERGRRSRSCCTTQVHGAVPPEGDRVPGEGRHGALHGRARPGRRPAASATTAKGCTTGRSSASRGAAERLTEEDFRTQSRARLQEMLLGGQPASLSRQVDQEAIDAKLDEAFERHRACPRPEDAQELAEWAQAELGVEVAGGGADRRDAGAGPAGAVERLRRRATARRCGGWSGACC